MINRVEIDPNDRRSDIVGVERNLIWGFGYSARVHRETVDGRESIVVGDRTRAKQMRIWIPVLVLLFFAFGCVGLFPTNSTGPGPHWSFRLGLGVGVPGALMGIILLLHRFARRELRKVLISAYDENGVLIVTRKGERLALRQDLGLHPARMERSLTFGARGRRASLFLCELGVPLFPIVCTKDPHRQRVEKMFHDALGVGVEPGPIPFWLDERTACLGMPDPTLISITLETSEDTDEPGASVTP